MTHGGPQVLGKLAGQVLGAVGGGAVVRHLWNTLGVSIWDIPDITYFQAFLIFILIAPRYSGWSSRND